MTAVGDDAGQRRLGRRSHRRERIPIEAGPPSLLYTVKQVELAVRHHLDELLRPAGVTTLQYTALTVLHRSSELTLTEIARNSFVTVQSTADLLRPLFEAHLIVRRPDPTHGRRQLISITPGGRDLLRDHQPAVEALEARMLGDLGAEQTGALRDLLQRCRAALA